MEASRNPWSKERQRPAEGNCLRGLNRILIGGDITGINVMDGNIKDKRMNSQRFFQQTTLTKADRVRLMIGANGFIFSPAGRGVMLGERSCSLALPHLHTLSALWVSPKNFQGFHRFTIDRSRLITGKGEVRTLARWRGCCRWIRVAWNLCLRKRPCPLGWL
jgi:hypothetical protein